jgi:transposase
MTLTGTPTASTPRTGRRTIGGAVQIHHGPCFPSIRYAQRSRRPRACLATTSPNPMVLRFPPPLGQELGQPRPESRPLPAPKERDDPHPDQSFLLPPDVRDWLPEGHLAWFVLDAVAGMDLREFYGAYRRDGVGRRAYDPAMVVALLLYRYSRGVRSARAIERACVEDVAFKMIAMMDTPDHATIARFVARHELALAELFGQVLGDFGQIAREILAEARAVNEAEDELYGDERGDELPEQAAHAGGPGRVLPSGARATRGRDARRSAARVRGRAGVGGGGPVRVRYRADRGPPPGTRGVGGGWRTARTSTSRTR